MCFENDSAKSLEVKKNLKQIMYLFLLSISVLQAILNLIYLYFATYLRYFNYVTCLLKTFAYIKILFL